ncbi:hypothetical protein BOX15_Mlig002598g1 [Macrostomum lignano]|uniref:Uncharacterized protein n=1 Tax=Macrostomum lignano TaxID=282301 RepID=A0A267E888_9PLAT|nr:hypothetical protein BOX15_Mlig002598g2 [Macrostomum lignano]PAA87244.1 hypothetical protein BOX15_Mlig002598g1 [Macrostomum lignano]
MVHVIISALCLLLLAISFAAYHRKRRKVAVAKQHRLWKRGAKLRMMSSAVGITQSLGLHFTNDINAIAGSGQLDFLTREALDSSNFSGDFGVPFGGAGGLTAGALDPGKKKGGLLMFDFRKQSTRASGGTG